VSVKDLRLYDGMSSNYVSTRQADPRIAQQIHTALGAAQSVLNVGAGTGNYEPTGRLVVAVEPSREMIARRSHNSGPKDSSAKRDRSLTSIFRRPSTPLSQPAWATCSALSVSCTLDKSATTTRCPVWTSSIVNRPGPAPTSRTGPAADNDPGTAAAQNSPSPLGQVPGLGRTVLRSTRRPRRRHAHPLRRTEAAVRYTKQLTLGIARKLTDPIVDPQRNITEHALRPTSQFARHGVPENQVGVRTEFPAAAHEAPVGARSGPRPKASGSRTWPARSSEVGLD
jgi:hypothetical protein